jgi:hypothetical protein
MATFNEHVDPRESGLRLREVAEIFAAAVVRLRLRAALRDADAGSQRPPESVSNGLEVPSETVLSVHTG